MIIKTEFDLKQLVYFVKDSTLHKGIITGIYYSSDTNEISYTVLENDFSYYDKRQIELFAENEKEIAQAIVKSLNEEKCEF